MDDIDHVVERLKRVDYDTLVSRLKNGSVINPHTYYIEYSKFNESICINHGWTLKELNEELYRRLYGTE